MKGAVRALWRSPGFTLVVTTTLALGIAANVAIFSLVNALFLRPLTVRDPHGLVILSDAASNAGKQIGNPSAQGERLRVYSHPLYERLRRDRQDVFAGLAAEDGAGSGGVIRWGEVRAPGYGRAVSDNYFQVLGVTAALGRTLSASDERAVVLAHHFWQRHFGSNPGVVGARVTLDESSFIVVGVAAPGFSGTKVADASDFWFPLGLKDVLDAPRAAARVGALADQERWWLRLVGRLRPGVSFAVADASVNLTLRQHLADHWPVAARAAQRIVVDPGGGGFTSTRERYRTQVTVLMAGAGLLLIIACLNVSQLFLARTLARRREIAVRAALGATRFQLLRPPLIEALILGGLGGAGGLLLSRWITDVLLALAATEPARDGLNVAADSRVIAFTLLMAIGSAVSVVLMTAAPLQTQPRSRAVTVAPKSALLTAQVALSMGLLVAAGLLVVTFANVRGADRGLDQRQLYGVSTGGAPVPPALINEVAAVPDVQSVGASTQWLDAGSGHEVTLEGSGHKATLEAVTAGYLATLGMRLNRGRWFSEAEIGRGAVITAGLAAQISPSGDALGARFRIAAQPRESLPVDTFEVIGVVDDLLVGNPRRSPKPVIYVATDQWPSKALRSMLVRARPGVHVGQLTPGLNEAFRRIDARLPPPLVGPVSAVFERYMRGERLLATLATAFGLAAALLVCLGLSGVVSQWASQRTREIGIRMAIGASSGGIQRLVMRQAFTGVGVGVLIGAPAAMIVAHLLRGSLYGVSGTWPTIWLAAAGGMGVVAAAAAYLPARRASRVDPMVALRQE